MDSGNLVPISLFGAMAWVSWILIVSVRRLLIARMQTGIQARLLDRLPSADSLIAYSETASGRDFITSLLDERASRSAPYQSILNGVQAAILLSVFGATLLLLHRTLAFSGDGELVFGAISLALGVGFALAAGANLLLASRFGLLTPPKLSHPAA